MRTVIGKHVLTSTAIEIVLCDKYMNPLTEASLLVTTDSDGMFSVELEANAEDTCYVAMTSLFKKQFWVYAGEGEQEVDLTKEVYIRRTLPSLLSAKDGPLSENAVLALGKSYKGCPMVSQEEKRFVCRYSAFFRDDAEVCRMDKLISKEY